MPSRLEEAIDLMNQAIEMDSSKHYQEALKLYENGIEFFLEALHSEVEGELARDAVVSKCKQYCTRAEELRQRMNEKTGGKANPKEAVEIQERHLPQAIEILTRARQEDGRENNLAALRLYEQGLYHYDLVLGYEIYSEKFKEALQARRKVYEERMNMLREKLHLN